MSLVPEATINLDRPRTLRMDLNALINIDKAMGRPVMYEGLWQTPGHPQLWEMRIVVWAALLHEDPELTEEAVGRYIRPSMIGELMHTLTGLMNDAMPDERDEDGGEGGQNGESPLPDPAAASNGKRSGQRRDSTSASTKANSGA